MRYPRRSLRPGMPAAVLLGAQLPLVSATRRRRRAPCLPATSPGPRPPPAAGGAPGGRHHDPGGGVPGPQPRRRAALPLHALLRGGVLPRAQGAAVGSAPAAGCCCCRRCCWPLLLDAGPTARGVARLGCRRQRARAQQAAAPDARSGAVPAPLAPHLLPCTTPSCRPRPVLPTWRHPSPCPTALRRHALAGLCGVHGAQHGGRARGVRARRARLVRPAPPAARLAQLHGGHPAARAHLRGRRQAAPQLAGCAVRGRPGWLGRAWLARLG